MKIKSVETAFLATSCGKYVSVQGTIPKYSHQLVAKNEQGYDSSKVKVYNITYDKTRQCMAFGFEAENESVVFPVVTHSEEINVQVISKAEPITATTFDETFLFQWGEREICGNWRSLKSVAEPKKYLCVKQGEVGEVTITEQKIPDFKIHYQTNKVLQDRCASVKIQDYEINPRKKIWQRRVLKRGLSCCEGSVAPNKPQRYNNRKTKRMKTSVKS